MDFDTKHRPHFESLLEPGEELLGIIAAAQRKGMFKGGAAAIGVTDRRLLIQPTDRRGEVDGEVLALTEDRIADAKAEDAGGGWMNAEAAIMDNVAVRLRLRTTDGEKLDLTMMRGEGRLMGKLAGGPGQQRGIEELSRWFGSRGESP
jgi:hypothetical protein